MAWEKGTKFPSSKVGYSGKDKGFAQRMGFADGGVVWGGNPNYDPIAAAVAQGQMSKGQANAVYDAMYQRQKAAEVRRMAAAQKGKLDPTEVMEEGELQSRSQYD